MALMSVILTLIKLLISDEMDITTIIIDKLKYNKQQHTLISAIAKALGCYSLGRADIKNKVYQVDVYGKAVDRERVAMLFSVASLTMVASAFKAVPSGSYNIRMRRLSHMIGYAKAILDSLQGHEAKARSGNTGDGALAILDDRSKAESFALAGLDEGFSVADRKGSKVDYNSYNSGYAEGSKFDTGKTGRISGKRALSA